MVLGLVFTHGTGWFWISDLLQVFGGFLCMQELFHAQYVLIFSYRIMDTYGNMPGAHQAIPGRNNTAMGMNGIRS